MFYAVIIGLRIPWRNLSMNLCAIIHAWRIIVHRWLFTCGETSFFFVVFCFFVWRAIIHVWRDMFVYAVVHVWQSFMCGERPCTYIRAIIHAWGDQLLYHHQVMGSQGSRVMILLLTQYYCWHRRHTVYKVMGNIIYTLCVDKNLMVYSNASLQVLFTGLCTCTLNIIMIQWLYQW